VLIFVLKHGGDVAQTLTLPAPTCSTRFGSKSLRRVGQGYIKRHFWPIDWSMGDQKTAVEVPVWMPSGKRLVLFTCLAGCVVIAGALATTALANHKQAAAAASAVAKPAK
jgi:hypothetical protein